MKFDKIKNMLTTNYKIILLVLIFLAATSGYLHFNRPDTKRTPTTPEATSYVSDKIIVNAPIPNSIVRSPLTVSGQARGNWYFEASFPVKLLDANGIVLASGPAQAKSDWMTTDFVSFEIKLTFDKPPANKGFLELEKDNPSGLPEFDDSIKIPILFSN